MRSTALQSWQQTNSLNPYFNGIYFLIARQEFPRQKRRRVLILILMEYTFWYPLKWWRHESFPCLNPYFNGIYFLINWNHYRLVGELLSLNPYFNGIYFLINENPSKEVLEKGLNPYFNGIYFLIID